jgi:hypothetical protein
MSPRFKPEASALASFEPLYYKAANDEQRAAS